jgi:hypothetical protein
LKIVLIVIGVLIALAGAGCTVGGVALLAAAGTDGWIESDTGRIDTTTFALVSEPALIEDEGPGAADRFDDLPDFRVRIEASQTSGNQPLFIGVASAADVDRYLSGVQYDVIDDFEFDPFRITKQLVPGERRPDRPGEQDFWEQSASGAGTLTLNWKLVSGSHRFVLMNANASDGVDLQASVAAKIPYVVQISIGLLVAGVIAVMLGILIVVLAARSGDKQQPASSPPAV